jgi:hypothetical protein
MNTSLLVTVGLVVVVLISVYYYNKPVNRAGASLLDDADNDGVRELFIKAASTKFTEIANCVSKEFSKKYTYTEALEMVTEDNFKNNPDIRKILNACTLDVLRGFFLLVLGTRGNECAKKNPQFVIDWIFANVEYRVLTQDERKTVRERIYKELENVCWSDAAAKFAVGLTNTRIGELIGAGMDENLYKQFVSLDKYKKWVGSTASAAVRAFRDAGGRRDVYMANLPKMTGAEIDGLTDNGFAKISIQAQMAAALYKGGWCKDIPQLMQAINPVPMQVYSDEDARKIMAQITEKWCWDPALLHERVAQTLQKTF